MKLALVVLLIVGASWIEVWSGVWLGLAGIAWPLTGLAVFAAVRLMDSRYWPWLGLVAGLAWDIGGWSRFGQYSLYGLAIWMGARWWYERSGGRWRQWVTVIVAIGWVGLWPWYELVWWGDWQGMGAALVWYSCYRMLLVGLPLAVLTLLRPKQEAGHAWRLFG